MYEISSMGRALMLGGLKTGIGRVEENVARELSRRGDAELCFCAHEFQGAAADYVTQFFPGHRFAHAFWRSSLSRLLYGQMKYELGVSDPRIASNEQAGWRAKLRKCGVTWIKEHLRKIQTDALEHADLYHTSTGQVSRQLARSGLPIVTTIHDVIMIKFPEYSPQLIASDRARFLADLSPERFYLCDSHCTRDDLLELGRCDPAKVAVAHLAADASFRPVDALGQVEARQRLGLTQAPYFLSVCTLEPRKNLDTVVKAFAKFVREGAHKEVQLILTGATGWKTEALEQALGDSREARGRIILTGYVPDELLPALYSGALGFIYVPSYEGFGLPPLEAMQCGTPVVVSAISSLPEVVGKAALMVAPRDTAGIAKAMSLLASDNRLPYATEHCRKRTRDAFLMGKDGREHLRVLSFGRSGTSRRQRREAKLV